MGGLQARHFRWLLLALTAGVAGACTDFDTSRHVAPRGSIGREVFTMVCDRVGAQALREDITGESFHAVCHPDPDGKFADTVDASRLVALDPAATGLDGKPVPLELQRQRRAYRVARVEALAKHRAEVIAAVDAAIPNTTMAVDCTSDGHIGQATVARELADALSRLVDLYNDRTIPLLTESLARTMDAVRADPEAQVALARIAARDGYRPLSVASGVKRPLLAYPRLIDLGQSVLRTFSVDSDPYALPRAKVAGKGAADLRVLLGAAREEVRTATADPAPGPLAITVDAGGRAMLSRPRTSLELTRAALLLEDPALGFGEPRYVVRRDARGIAEVARVGGNLPAPFVDADKDGLADVDTLGRFVTNGAPVPSPFVVPDTNDTFARDPFGRAVIAGQPAYATIDSAHTALAQIEQDIRPLVSPQGDPGLMGFLGGLPVISGTRDQLPTAIASYPPDAKVAYRSFHPEDAPLLDLVYAVGQLLAAPETEDVLVLLRKLVTDHPQEIARLIGVGFKVKGIADAHPEAHIPDASTLWDEVLDVVTTMAAQPGLFEDVFKAMGDDRTLALKDVFAGYMAFRDELTYDKKNLNGPAFNLMTNDVSPLKTPVDRTKPDTGTNRSAFQRFLQILHDANGLGACTKQGAVAHVQWQGIPLDYPTNPLSKTACLFLTGKLPPDPMPMCGILRIENVDAMLVDVALGRAQFDIRDECLKKLVDSPLTGFVGGADAFLEDQSGIKGFSTHPTVNGVSRFVFYDTPHDGLPGDNSNPKTMAFFRDLLDPAPSMACAPAPFKDSDGKTINLRKCSSFKDTLRGRDNNATFPLEQLGFIQSILPLAAAFGDHGRSLDFVALFDALHRHWGSQGQSKDECDPSLPKTDAKWCTQDGGVSYEALIVEAIKTDLMASLHDFIPVLQKTTVDHCTQFDGVSHKCLATAKRDGVTVLVEGLRSMLLPDRNAGLVDRAGRAYAERNDGSKNPQVTPLYLLIDALKRFDAAFAKWAGAHGNDPTRLQQWRGARSQLVDALFGVEGSGTGSKFKSPVMTKVFPNLIDLIRAQKVAHCPDPSAPCPWARKELSDKLGRVLGGPIYAGTVDVIDDIQSDKDARRELLALLSYLLDPGAPNDAQATALAATTDALQIFSDDVDMTPLLRAGRDALGGDVADEKGAVTQRGMLLAAVEVLSRVLASAHDDKGQRQCAREIDPNRSVAVLLGNLVKSAPGQRSPLEVIVDVAAEVNRATPGSGAPFAPDDYGNISKEVSEFCMHPSRGLEQVYEVIRQATTEQ